MNEKIVWLKVASVTTGGKPFFWCAWPRGRSGPKLTVVWDREKQKWASQICDETMGYFETATQAKAQFRNTHLQSRRILFRASLGFGGSAWVEVSPQGIVAAKADFHPEDAINTLLIGTAKECFKAVQSVYRAKRNNWLGRINFGNHAPLDYPRNSTRAI